MSKPLTIAIDGYSSTGKSTLAKDLARHFAYAYVDSGAMYRAVALYAMRQGWVTPEFSADKINNSLERIEISFAPVEGVNTTFLNGENVEREIRSLEVSQVVSQVASLVPVRRHLVAQQQKMGANGGVVMDGRDIGSVVFPNAELKIFMTASDQVRAERRRMELECKGELHPTEEILANLKSRDKADMERLDSPLIQSKDAKVLDNSDLSFEEQFEVAKDWATQLL